MKKLILITSVFCVLLLTTNCSKDDDTATPTPISSIDLIGTWDLDYYVDSGALTEEIMCSEQVKYVFSKNNIYTKTTFSGEGTTNCDLAVTINGKWEDLGSFTYQLTPNGGTAEPILDIIFQDNFTKFISEVSATRTEVFSK